VRNGENKISVLAVRLSGKGRKIQGLGYSTPSNTSLSWVPLAQNQLITLILVKRTSKLKLFCDTFSTINHNMFHASPQSVFCPKTKSTSPVCHHLTGRPSLGIMCTTKI
jgi:hypothetical protein